MMQDMAATQTSQRFTARDSAVITEAERRRRRVLVLSEDAEWLSAFSTRPRLLLSRMASRGALHALGGGRYLITPPGRPSIHQAAPWQVVLDGAMHPYGDYYVGFLSALVEHHLTDLDSPTIYVAVQRRSDINQKPVVGNREVVVARIGDAKHWFGSDKVRISRSESYMRSDLERTLVDCLYRPDLCGSAELYVLGWARALRSDKVDVERLCDYALRLGSATARRSGFLLTIGGHADEARSYLSSVARPSGGADRFDASLPRQSGAERETEWGLHLNVSRNAIEGWFAYGK
jgi:predicted transcriptional regulator of viral defense system